MHLRTPEVKTAEVSAAGRTGPVHYADFGGEGPPILLVHGLGGSHLNWVTVAGPLTAHGRVLAVDLAGFGRTPLAGRRASVEANLALLDGFLRDVVREPAVLFGNSMGGLLSLMLAARAPGCVRGLVLVNPAQPLAPGAKPHPEVVRRFTIAALPGVGELALWWAARKYGPRAQVADLLRLCCVDASRVPRAAVEAHEVLAAERATSAPWRHAAYLEASRTLLRFLARPGRFQELVARVRCPTLLVHGAHDRLVPLASSEALARTRPDWRFECFTELGHTPQLEDPEAFLARVEPWLSTLGPAQVAAG
jgi:pimeloyl-ACP methyl ester carboxylesterase